MKFCNLSSSQVQGLGGAVTSASSWERRSKHTCSGRSAESTAATAVRNCSLRSSSRTSADDAATTTSGKVRAHT